MIPLAPTNDLVKHDSECGLHGAALDNADSDTNVWFDNVFGTANQDCIG